MGASLIQRITTFYCEKNYPCLNETVMEGRADDFLAQFQVLSYTSNKHNHSSTLDRRWSTLDTLIQYGKQDALLTTHLSAVEKPTQ